MRLTSLLIGLLWLQVLFSQQDCPTLSTAFKPGEVLSYKVIYNWGLVWLESGEASFTTDRVSNNGRNCYKFTGKGNTYSNYDWFFKVHDLFETTVDSADWRPQKFHANIREGGKHETHTYVFNNSAQKVYTIITRGRQPVKVDTVDITPCSIDVLTAIYYARSLDYSKCKVNDTLGISVMLDGKLFRIYVRYLGRGIHKSRKLGTFNCIKFSPLLVAGSIFKAGEGMTVWVTDDRNKLPLFIETPIMVGTVKVMLVDYKGLRFPVEARVSGAGH